MFAPITLSAKVRGESREANDPETAVWARPPEIHTASDEVGLPRAAG